MRLVTEWVAYEEARRRAYVARPEAVPTPLPVVLVIQEAWGVDVHIRDVAERFATAGYVAVAPDLYWEAGSRPPVLAEERVDTVKPFLDTIPPSAWGDPAQRQAALDSLPSGEGTAVGETLGAVFGNAGKVDEHVKVLRGLMTFLGDYGHTAGQPRVSVGFCMGGGLSFRLATEDIRLRAAVVCYGSPPDDDAIARLSCPVLGLDGAADHRITDSVPHVADVSRAAGRSYDYKIYPDTPHAFFNDTRSSYRIEAARDAWARILALFAEVTAHPVAPA
ncbi:MAG: dienelactone hydrolase family protein [Candidatus Dormibacteraeota bacterium]|uniref:Dienelactone hydrolase family protein n=1 Tax=Candidatus Aeolococcus gillhamiae TaxID=3127015 RepID=A0A934JZV9_9BACT|nr:dienelactone hydrolase family protein [Candidatus Dormibacteraeota bacterium]